MKVFKGSVGILESAGFMYNGNYEYYKTYRDPETGKLYELKIKYEHFRPVDCAYEEQKTCYECPYYNKCYTNRKNPTTGESVAYTRFRQVFRGVITEDSTPHDFLLKPLQGHIVEE